MCFRQIWIWRKTSHNPFLILASNSLVSWEASFIYIRTQIHSYTYICMPIFIDLMWQVGKSWKSVWQRKPWVHDLDSEDMGLSPRSATDQSSDLRPQRYPPWASVASCAKWVHRPCLTGRVHPIPTGTLKDVVNLESSVNYIIYQQWVYLSDGLCLLLFLFFSCLWCLPQQAGFSFTQEQIHY